MNLTTIFGMVRNQLLEKANEVLKLAEENNIDKVESVREIIAGIKTLAENEPLRGLAITKRLEEIHKEILKETSKNIKDEIKKLHKIHGDNFLEAMEEYTSELIKEKEKIEIGKKQFEEFLEEVFVEMFGEPNCENCDKKEECNKPN